MTGRTSGAGPILLFGATGQIGWELMRCLAPLGTVVAPSRTRADLVDPASVVRCIREAAPRLIVNAAAYTAVDAAEQDRDTAAAVNATAPGVMAEEAKRLAVPLVHYSTDYVFDGRPADGTGSPVRPYRETDRPAPLNVYGQSKLDGERAIQSVGPMHLILRTSWVYSRRGKNFLLTIQRLAAEFDELRIVDDQCGSPTFARSIAEATAEIIRKSCPPSRTPQGPDLSEIGGCYHLSASGSTTWCGFARAILEADSAAGCSTMPRLTPIATSEYPTPARRPAYSVLDNSALRATFGIALPSWQSQLRRCLEDR